MTYRSHENLNDLLSQLEDKLPSTAIITTFSSSAEQFSMGVTVPDKVTAEKFLLQLKTISYISDVYISGLSETEGSETSTKEVSFSVQCTYAGKDNVTQEEAE